MILDTGTIREGHSVIRQISDLASVKDELPPFGEKIVCEAEVNRSNTTIYVKVHFEGGFEQECARCCEVFQYPVSGVLTLVLEEKEGRHGPAQEHETADFYFDTRHQSVDLSPAIYDEIMTELPLKPLCRETCKGILFEPAEKRMDKQEIDPRWATLLKLKRDN